MAQIIQLTKMVNSKKKKKRKIIKWNIVMNLIMKNGGILK